MKKQLVFILILILFTISCASVENKYSAEVYDSNGKLTQDNATKLGLAISAEEDSDLSSQYFGLIHLTFKNESQNWIKIENITLDFGSDDINESIKIVSGNDIIAWNDAMQKLIQINEYNTNLVLGTIAVLGTTAAIASSKGDIKAVGALTGLGGLTALTVNDYNKNLSRIENEKIFPKNHLMSQNLIIPPGLFSKRWVLLNSSNHNKIGVIETFKMIYKTENGETESVKVNFRPIDPWNYKWQSRK